MKVKIAKWGNSLAVRLPKRLADELDLAPGTTVDLEKQGSKLTIESTVPKIPYYRLEDLLAQIKRATGGHLGRLGSGRRRRDSARRGLERCSAHR